jgi:hypothetical protein
MSRGIIYDCIFRHSFLSPSFLLCLFFLLYLNFFLWLVLPLWNENKLRRRELLLLQKISRQDNIRCWYLITSVGKCKPLQVIGQLSQVTNCMRQGLSWEANSRSASQEFSRLLSRQKIHYRIQRTRHRLLSPTIRMKSTPQHDTSS